MAFTFTVEGPPEFIRSIEEIDEPDIQVGVAEPTASAADVLDSPIGVDELRQATEVITMILTTSGAFVALATKIRAFFSKKEKSVDAKRAEPSHEGATSTRITFRDPKSNAVVAVVDGAESLEVFLAAHS